jgi:hypothetical protein
MRIPPWLTLLALAACAPVPVPPPAQGERVALAQRPTPLELIVVPADRAVAERYSVDVPDSDIDAGGSVIRIQGSMDRVLVVVRDFKRYVEILPRIRHSRVVGKRARMTDVYLEAPILNGLARAWGVARFPPPRPWAEDGLILEGTMVKGNLEAWWGRWKLQPCGEQCTTLRLEMFVDPDLPFPASVITRELEWATDKAVSAVRDKVELGRSTVKGD